MRRDAQPPLTHNFDIGGVIYKIIQRSSGRIYFGITDCAELRLPSHFKHRNEPTARLHQEIMSNGVEDFIASEIARLKCSRKTLREIERALIRMHNTIWPGGLNSI